MTARVPDDQSYNCPLPIAVPGVTTVDCRYVSTDIHLGDCVWTWTTYSTFSANVSLASEFAVKRYLEDNISSQ